MKPPQEFSPGPDRVGRIQRSIAIIRHDHVALEGSKTLSIAPLHRLALHPSNQHVSAFAEALVSEAFVSLSWAS